MDEKHDACSVHAGDVYYMTRRSEPRGLRMIMRGTPLLKSFPPCFKGGGSGKALLIDYILYLIYLPLSVDKS